MPVSMFLYLTYPEWAKAWIDGGEVPIQLASFYRSTERDGTKTPDENIIKKIVGTDEKSINRVAQIAPGAKCDIRIGKLIVGDQIRGENVSFQQDYQDGLILSFSLYKSKKIAKKLKKAVCVQVYDIEVLCAHISEQIGMQGIHGKCEYTTGPNRNIFLKHADDKWQHEYRFYWGKIIENPPLWVSIKAGTARIEAI